MSGSARDDDKITLIKLNGSIGATDSYQASAFVHIVEASNVLESGNLNAPGTGKRSAEIQCTSELHASQNIAE